MKHSFFLKFLLKFRSNHSRNLHELWRHGFESARG